VKYTITQAKIQEAEGTTTVISLINPESWSSNILELEIINNTIPQANLSRRE
jgi:hypothetical protein